MFPVSKPAVQSSTTFAPPGTEFKLEAPKTLKPQKERRPQWAKAIKAFAGANLGKWFLVATRPYRAAENLRKHLRQTLGVDFVVKTVGGRDEDVKVYVRQELSVKPTASVKVKPGLTARLTAKPTVPTSKKVTWRYNAITPDKYVPTAQSMTTVQYMDWFNGFQVGEPHYTNMTADEIKAMKDKGYVGLYK